MKLAALLSSLLLSGCALFTRPPGIRAGNTSVTGLPDAGKPATLSQGETRSGVTIPAQTPVSITRVDAVAATDTSPFQPASEEITFTPLRDTRIESQSTTVNANTGTVDTSIALKKIQAGEDRILLYAAIAAALAGGFFLYIKYPTPAYISAGASAIFFAAWKLAELPTWFWGLGAVGLAAAVFLYLGHKRGESDGLNSPLPPVKIIPPS